MALQARELSESWFYCSLFLQTVKYYYNGGKVMRRSKVNVKVDSRREILPQDTSKMDGKDWQEKQYLTA